MLYVILSYKNKCFLYTILFQPSFWNYNHSAIFIFLAEDFLQPTVLFAAVLVKGPQHVELPVTWVAIHEPDRL